MPSFLPFLAIAIFLNDCASAALSWTYLEYTMPTSRGKAAVGLVNNEIIYVFGGNGGNSGVSLQSITKLDLSQSNPSWTTLTSRSTPADTLSCAHQCAATMQNRYIYLFDFFRNYYAVWDGQVEQFVSNHGITKPIGVTAFGCIVGDGHEFIYQFGQTSWRFDISRKQWTSLSAPPNGQTRQFCVFHADFADDGDVIFMQSRDDAVIYKYIISLDEWRIVPISAAIFRFNTDGVLAADGNIYVIGGENPLSTVVQIFDPRTNQVYDVTELLSLSGGAAQSVLVHDKIFVFGGYNAVYTYLSRGQVSNALSVAPTNYPTATPTTHVPSTANPTTSPTLVPTFHPTAVPTADPTNQPTSEPTKEPTTQPTSSPSASPTESPSSAPTTQPTSAPSASPTESPSSAPTTQPTVMPSMQPTALPTLQPSGQPSVSPTMEPTAYPTVSPTRTPSDQPTKQPTENPTFPPTIQPTVMPTRFPSTSPSVVPTMEPTTASPTVGPTTQTPTFPTTSNPTKSPSVPTSEPTAAPFLDEWFMFNTTVPSDAVMYTIHTNVVVVICFCLVMVMSMN